MKRDSSADVTTAHGFAAPTIDPLIRERVRRTLRERLFAIAEPPVTLGRFVVLDRVGSGGMATVYAAYDPQLERKVALKVIRGAEDDAGRERLVREARTMARLAHPHVATVYDVAVVDGSVVIAMEYAAAGTLREWIHRQPRRWTEILDAFVQAARGLCAAHDAGIVHRDFKPENALVADDGRILVTDFGIARSAGAATSALRDGERAAQASSVAGTLRYMAPEQLRGSAIDARTDQFSWCVCLFEALYGQHPFVGETAAEIAQATVDGNRRPGVATRSATALMPLLDRGLAVAIDRRYPSLRDLVAAIERRRRRGSIWIVAASVTAIAAGGVGWSVASSAPLACQDAATELAGVWDDGRAARLRAAFEGTGVPYAATTFESLRRNLDAHARDWLTLRAESCEATHVRGAQSERWLAARYRCLDARRRELGALVDVFLKPDRELVERANDAVAKLTPASVCAEAQPEIAIDPAWGPAGALDRRLDETEAQMRAGRYRAALEIAESVATAARPLSYDPLLARALHLRGLLEGQVGAAAKAVESLYEASRIAARARADWRAAEVAIDLVYQVVYAQSQQVQLEPLKRAAEAAVERVGSPPRLLVSLHRTLGIVTRQAGDVEASLIHNRRSLEVLQRLGSHDASELATAYSNLANVYRDKGDHASALGLYEQALELQRERLGDEHPAIAHTLNNMAIVFENRSRFEDAMRRYQRARAIFERSLGVEHPHVAMTLNNLANTVRKQGRPGEAIELAERSAAIFTKARGADHPHVAWPLNTLGLALTATHEFERAYEVLSRARKIRVARLGDKHPLVAMVDNSLGVAYLEAGRARDAVAALESALVVRRSTRAAPAVIAESAFPLARALWQVGDKPRALELAREARTLVAGSDVEQAGELGEIDRWLAAHVQ